MTPTGKAEGVRERARESIADFMREMGWEDYDAMLPDMLTDHVTAFAESESALARKEEREACAKAICGYCVSVGGGIKTAQREKDERIAGDYMGWFHEVATSEGWKKAPCYAAAIHERNMEDK